MAYRKRGRREPRDRTDRRDPHDPHERALKKARAENKKNGITADLLLEEIDGKPSIFNYGDVMYDFTRAKRVQKEMDDEKNPTELRMSEFAEILEIIVFDGIEDHEWFGGDAQAIKTALFDDLFNGTDLIIEMNPDEGGTSYLGLGIDVTFAGYNQMVKKLEGIRDQIKSGKLTHIKYFCSADLTLKGSKSKIPRLLIALNPDDLENIRDIWLDQPRQLTKHPVKLKILRQLFSQLKLFQIYAENCNQQKVADILKNMEKTLRNSLDEEDREAYKTVVDRKHTELMAAIQEVAGRGMLTKKRKFARE